MNEWHPDSMCGDSKPDSLDLIDALCRSRVPSLPAVPRAMSYIDRCRSQGESPDLARIFRTLLPEAPVPPFLEPEDSDHLFPDEKPC